MAQPIVIDAKIRTESFSIIFNCSICLPVLHIISKKGKNHLKISGKNSLHCMGPEDSKFTSFQQVLGQVSKWFRLKLLSFRI